MTEQEESKRWLSPTAVSLGAPVVGVVIGLLIGAVMMVIADVDPLEA